MRRLAVATMVGEAGRRAARERIAMVAALQEAREVAYEEGRASGYAAGHAEAMSITFGQAVSALDPARRRGHNTVEIGWGEPRACCI